MRNFLSHSLLYCWLFLFPANSAFAGSIALNELIASNTRGASDEDGEHSDWIEIYNSSSADISLASFGLTDDPGRPFRWLIPDVTVEAHGFLLIWATGKDRIGPALHTNFSLSKDGEFVGLYSPEGFLVDDVFFDEQSPDVSFGRIV